MIWVIVFGLIIIHCKPILKKYVNIGEGSFALLIFVIPNGFVSPTNHQVLIASIRSKHLRRSTVTLIHLLLKVTMSWIIVIWWGHGAWPIRSGSEASSLGSNLVDRSCLLLKNHLPRPRPSILYLVEKSFSFPRSSPRHLLLEVWSSSANIKINSLPLPSFAGSGNRDHCGFVYNGVHYPSDVLRQGFWSRCLEYLCMIVYDFNALQVSKISI